MRCPGGRHATDLEPRTLRSVRVKLTLDDFMRIERNDLRSIAQSMPSLTCMGGIM